MISVEKLKILTPFQKLPKNVGDLSKIIIAKGFKNLPKVQLIAKSGHTGRTLSHREFEFLVRVESQLGAAADAAKDHSLLYITRFHSCIYTTAFEPEQACGLKGLTSVTRFGEMNIIGSS